MERKHFIDNLRWLTILMLFPFHAAQIWSGGAYYGFYVWSHTDNALFVFSNLVYPWFLTLMFTLAGMSMHYALVRRTKKKFFTERTKKLLIPLFFGTFVLCPIMTYVGEVFFNGYTGSYLHQYVLFFTKPTDMTGYRGGFTPGHYWFLLYLYVISLITLLILFIKEKNQKIKTEKTKEKALPYWVLILFFVPEWICNNILNIGGKSIGQFLFLFLIGYFVLTNEKNLMQIKKNRYLSLILAVVSGSTYVWLYCGQNCSNFFVGVIYQFYGWTGILTLLGFSQVFLNVKNKCSSYLSKASYPIYIIHMPVLVVVGFFTLKLSAPVFVQFLIIIVGSFVATMLLYEILRRIPGLRHLVGISKK